MCIVVEMYRIKNTPQGKDFSLIPTLRIQFIIFRVLFSNHTSIYHNY